MCVGIDPLRNRGKNMRREISSSCLTKSAMPPEGASWDDVSSFALTFNGYDYRTDLGEYANQIAEDYEIRGADSVAGLALDDLRACLFFEQRRCRHSGRDPEGPDWEYVRCLLEAIRSRVSPQ